MTFVAMLQTYVSFETHSPFKSVMLKKNNNLNSLQCFESVLHSSFDEEALFTSYASLPVSRFSELR
jgi:hypothetical protein